MNKLACPTVDELSRFNLGKLPEDETIQIGEHLDECEACRAMIDTISDASDTLASALKRPAPHNEYENESGLQRAALLIQAIGREPSFGSGQDAVSSKVDVADLGELGQYKLLAKLGEGGMGAVYKALHTSLKRLVALKVLPTERMRDEQAVNRFRREMEAVGQLDHPNIVRATDAGEVDQTHYLVMELVDGIDLSTLVRRVGPLAPAVACELIRQAAVGLQEAHEHGMVHRDIKPSNLMLASRRRKEPIVKVLDLGLALLDEHRTSEQRGLTSTGQMMGTLDYMAPEQGGDSHEVDIRADIYALGATLYKLLCGQAPFAGEKYDTPIKMIRALALETPASIGEKRNDLPAELVAVVDRMLAKNPDDRFAEPEEVAEALAPFAKGADLALLLRKATEEDAENIEEASGVATHESLKSDSVETAPTIGLGSASRRGEAPGSPIEPTQVMKPATAKASRLLVPISQLSRLWNRVPPRARIATIAAAAAGILMLSATIFYVKTNHGTIVVEIDDPAISVTVQGEDIQITKNDSGEAYQIKPGEHTLHVKHGDLEFDTDKFKLRRGEKVVLSVRLAEEEVQVVQKDDKHKVIGSRQLPMENLALAFDGNSNYVEIPSLTYDAKHPITVEAWASLSAREVGVIVYFDGSNFLSLSLAKKDRWQFLGFDGKRDQLAYSEIPPVESAPVHIAGVWVPGESPKLFVNGNSASVVSEGDGVVPGLKSGMFRIGASNDFSKSEKHLRRFFHGVIDEVRISSVARYDKDFAPAERFEPDEHTLALYHFDEGQGEIAHDSSPNKHHGKIVGAKWVTADSIDRNIPETPVPPTTSTAAVTLHRTFQGTQPQRFVEFDATGEFVAASGKNGDLHVWKVETGEEIKPPFEVDRSTSQPIDFSPVAPVLAVGLGRSTVLWNIDTNQVSTFPKGSDASALQFHPSGDYLALGTGSFNVIRLWRISDKSVTQSITTTGHVRSIAFSPDAKLIATGGDEGVVLFEAETGEVMAKMDSNATTNVRFSLDGTWLVASFPMNDVVKIWDVASEEITLKLSHSGQPDAIAFLPDNRYLAVAGRNASAFPIYEMESGSRLSVGVKHRGVFGLAFSPSGKLLASAGTDDRNVKIWQIHLDDSDPNRRAASWAIQFGGEVKIRELASGKESTINKLPLPEPTFELVGIAAQARVIPNGDLQALAGLKSIEYLYLGKNSGLDDAHVNVVMTLASLRHLILSVPQLTDNAFSNLGKLQELEMINLAATQITGATLATLEQLARLEHVTLDYCKSITAADFKHLRGCKRLVSVTLNGTNIGDAGLSYLESIGSLKSVRCPGTKVTVTGVAKLKAALRCKIESDFTDEEIAVSMEKLKAKDPDKK